MDDRDVTAADSEELPGEEQVLDTDARILDRQESDGPDPDRLKRDAPGVPDEPAGPAEGGD